MGYLRHVGWLPLILNIISCFIERTLNMRRFTFILLIIFWGAITVSANTRIENDFGGIRVGIDSIEKAKKILGSSYFDYGPSNMPLATYVWFDKKTNILIQIQLATNNFKENGMVNTIIVSTRYPEFSEDVLKKINRKKYLSKVDLSKLSTSRGLKITDNYKKTIKLYGKAGWQAGHSKYDYIL